MISILITTYNSAKFIKHSIRSVLEQTFRDFELVIVNDGSQDNTEEIVISFRDDRINYYKIDHVGRSKALNFGLKKCKYDWVAIIDADDLWHKKKLEIQRQYLNDKKHFVICHSAFFKRNKIIYFEKSWTDSGIKKKMILYPGFSHISVIYNKEVILSVGGYNEMLFNGVDYDLWIRILDKVKFVVVTDILVFVRINKDSLSRKNPTLLRNNVYNIQNHYIQLLSKYHSNNELIFYNAWREYLFGNRKKARAIWMENLSFLLKDYRVAVAFIITLLPEKLFERILAAKLKLRLKYFSNKSFNRKVMRDLDEHLFQLVS